MLAQLIKRLPVPENSRPNHWVVSFVEASNTKRAPSMPTPGEPTANFWSALAGGHTAATFTAKGFGLSANVHGKLSLETDPDVTDRVWHSYIAAWYAGKDDPKLALLRLDDEEAESRRAGSSLIAGIKTMLGYDPNRDYAENVATVALA